MAWETRGNRRYFYRSERVGGRVVKHYEGSEMMAEVVGLLQVEKKASREAERAKVRAEQEELSQLEAVLAPLDEIARVAVEEAMQAAGFHRTKRGPWRKRRVQVEGTDSTDPTDSPRPGSKARGTP
jgi:hypothetical protein